MKELKEKITVHATEFSTSALQAFIHALTDSFYEHKEEYLECYDKGREYEVEIKVIPKKIIKRAKEKE